MKYFLSTLVILATQLASWQVFAADDNILGISNEKLRKGDVHIDDIPVAISSLINFFMGIAGTIAVIMIVIGAYKILFGSMQNDRSKWKQTIIMALVWFALAALAWVIIKTIISNLA